ncbi:MAG: tetratricopeptide repeat protein [Nodosilinea sp.]
MGCTWSLLLLLILQAQFPIRFNVELQDFIVRPTAVLLIAKHPFWGVWHRWALRNTLQALTASDRILQPRDGQIEAKGYTVEAGEYLPKIGKLLIQLSNQQPQRLATALTGFTVAAVGLQRYALALKTNSRLTQISPQDAVVWYNQGWLFNELDDKTQAIACYDAALAIKPDDHEALNNKGNALSALGQNEAAIACYDAALAIKPDFHEVLNNKGNVLAASGQNEAAIACYDDALAIKPDFHKALYNKAFCYGTLGAATKAIEALQKAIALYPQYREMAKVGSGFNSIRTDERFRALVEEMGEG